MYLTQDANFFDHGYLLNIVGDYYIECIMPDILNSYFELIFQSVDSLGSFNSNLYQEIFKMKAPCQISVIYSPTKTELFRKKILKWF